jgi:hypothetical protein
MKHPYVFSLYEWIPKGVPLAEIGYPYTVRIHGEISNNWRFIASGTKAEMDALEKLMTASINRELINEIFHTGETDGT